MAMKLSDIFKGNIMIDNYIEFYYGRTTLFAIFDKSQLVHTRLRTIKLSWILSGKIRFVICTDIYNVTKKYETYTQVVISKNKFRMRYNCAKCHATIRYVKKNPKLLCDICRSKGVVKW